MDISSTTFAKQAALTAEHFGFENIESLSKDPACKDCVNKLTSSASAQERKQDALQGMLTGGIEIFCTRRLNALERPLLFYSIESVPRSGDLALTLQVYNVGKSIAEATLIQASRALLSDLGYENLRVRINSLGDRESSTRYARELTNFLKKRLDDMPETARELMKEHAFSALTHLVEKGHDLAYRSPNPLEYLSDQSRKHFREIVEFLDMAELHYEIDPKLLGHHECYSDALFTIDILDDESVTLPTAPIIARGGRYSEFVERSVKQTIPAAGAVIILQNKKAPARLPRVKLQRPEVYVVQLGFGPKIKSLILIDELRQAGINAYQNLPSDSLSNQLRDAENKGVRYVVIIGQKEYVEQNVILRDMSARNQEQVSLDTLISKLKRAKKTLAAA